MKKFKCREFWYRLHESGKMPVTVRHDSKDVEPGEKILFQNIQSEEQFQGTVIYVLIDTLNSLGFESKEPIYFIFFNKDLKELWVCPECGYHFDKMKIQCAYYDMECPYLEIDACNNCPRHIYDG